MRKLFSSAATHPAGPTLSSKATQVVAQERSAQTAVQPHSGALKRDCEIKVSDWCETGSRHVCGVYTNTRAPEKRCFIRRLVS